MKLYAVLNENNICIGYEINQGDIELSYAQCISNIYSNRKYDKENQKWLDEYDYSVSCSPIILPNWQILQILSFEVEKEKQEIEQLKARQKDDTLVLLKAIVEGITEMVEILSSIGEGGTEQ